MIKEIDYSKFYPVMDFFNDDRERRGWSYVPLAGWLRGDSSVEAHGTCEEVPSRISWNHNMLSSKILETLNIKKDKFADTKDFYKALVQFIQDTGVIRDSEGTYWANICFILQVNPADIGINTKFQKWFALMDTTWTEESRTNFTTVFGIVPRKITENVWLISEKENKNDL